MKKVKQLKYWHVDVSNYKNMTSRTFYGDTIIHMLITKTSYFMKTMNYRPRKLIKTKDEPLSQVFYMWRTMGLAAMRHKL